MMPQNYKIIRNIIFNPFKKIAQGQSCLYNAVVA